MIAALDQVVGRRWPPASFVFVDSDEDIHTAIERRVTELAGPTGAKLHTGRSRNDQAATGVRLWMKRELMRDRPTNRRPADGPARSGRRPPATSTCRATRTCSAPSRCCSSHHLLAHGWALGRDVERILDAIERIDVSPLGAGALAGSSLPLDPDVHRQPSSASLARSRTRSTRSVDRDHVAEALFDLDAGRRSTCRASARSSCCGPPRSSASPASTTPTPPARRCCRRRRTPTSPSWRAARRVG